MPEVAMDVNVQNLQLLAHNLEQTFSPELQVRKEAERFLTASQSSPKFCVLLMHFISLDTASPPTRIAASLCLKNFLKFNWKLEDGEVSKINQQDRTYVKDEILRLMLSMPDNIQSQLSEVVTIICKQDFPQDWPNLLPQMVERLGSGDFNVINGVLKTAHSIFKEYRHQFKSDNLFREIKYVLDGFALPLTQLFQATCAFCEQHAENLNVLKVLFDSLILMTKIFYSLNYQDLPEFFEDNMDPWMDQFHKLLNLNNPVLVSTDEEVPGPLENLKSQICHNVGLYAQKYDEEFHKFLPIFVQDVWNLLLSTGLEVKYDFLVSNGIQFLSFVAERDTQNEIYSQEGTLQSICEKIIIPNMQFRASDEEIFEDNPEEFIRRDVEGSDTDTRRRSACDLVRSLMTKYEAPVTSIFTSYVAAMLQQYCLNPSQNWKAKDAAIYLVTSLAVKSKTAGKGVTKTNDLVDIAQFFSLQILPDLQPNSSGNIFLKADALKYVMTFRNQLSKEHMVEIFPLIIHSLENPNYVVHSYAAMCVDQLLTIKDNKVPRCGPNDIRSVLESLLSGLFSSLSFSCSHENEHLMRAVMRTIVVFKSDLAPFMPRILSQLSFILKRIYKNPGKPRFTHFFFESIGALVRFICVPNPSLGEAFEQYLFPSFQEILASDLAELLPYVFQILAVLLELRPVPVPDFYMEIFRALMSPILWERSGNVPALVKLISSYLKKCGPQIVVQYDCMNPILGVFQKLIASRANDHEGFLLLASIVLYLPFDLVGKYLKDIYTVLLQRLQRAKTVKFVKGFLSFTSLLAAMVGADVVIDCVDSIQPHLFAMIVKSLYIAELQKVSDPIEKKTCAIGIVKILCCPKFFAEPYLSLWGPFLNALVLFFELPDEADNASDEERLAVVEESAAYQGSFCQLIYLGVSKEDPFSSISDLPCHLAASLAQVSQSLPGKLAPLLQQSLSSEISGRIFSYIQRAGVSIS